METRTLILTPRYTKDSQALWRAASYELMWDVVRLQSSDLVAYSEGRIPEGLNLNKPIIYVEALYAPMIGEAYGVKLEEPPFDFLPNLPIDFRKRSIELGKYGDLTFTEPKFIKPPGFKSFPAKVYDTELPAISSNEMVLVSEPVNFELEFRFFIAERQAFTSSMYARNGVSNYDCLDEEYIEAKDFVQKLMDSEVKLPKAIVIDVGRIKDRGWAIVELNPPWGSGIYNCEPERVLQVLQREQS